MDNLLNKMTKCFCKCLNPGVGYHKSSIDGLFYKALTEAPQAILTRNDGNALKIPVKVLVVLVCIIQLMNMSFSIYIYIIQDSYEIEQRKKDWPIIISCSFALLASMFMF